MTAKPTFTFFKMLGCGACSAFDSQLFQTLIADPEVLRAVNVTEVMFGRNGNEVLELDSEYPDLKPRVKYAPFLWLSAPYDEGLGYHLNPETRNNADLNQRLVGDEYVFQRSSTYQDLKRWILNTASKYQPRSFMGFQMKKRK